MFVLRQIYFIVAHYYCNLRFLANCILIDIVPQCEGCMTSCVFEYCLGILLCNFEVFVRLYVSWRLLDAIVLFVYSQVFGLVFVLSVCVQTVL